MSRPGTGLSWDYRQHVEGKKVKSNLPKGHQIEFGDLNNVHYYRWLARA